MRRNMLLGTAALLTLTAASWAAGPIELLPGVKLQAAGEVIDDAKSVGHFVPTVVDWNGDGKKDLIVGSFTGSPGNVKLFLNLGTDAEPKLDKPVLLEAAGVPIKLTGG